MITSSQMQKFQIIDSGRRQEFPTGSLRDSREGKGRFDLLPCRAMRRLAQHFEGGGGKYGDRNWENGQPLSRFMDSALRHAFAHLQGLRDEDHAVAAAWNLLCMVDTEMRIREGLLPKELNDLPNGELNGHNQRHDPVLVGSNSEAKD